MTKADFIREGLAECPDMKPEDLAKVLNELAEVNKYEFEVKPSEVSATATELAELHKDGMVVAWPAKGKADDAVAAVLLEMIARGWVKAEYNEADGEVPAGIGLSLAGKDSVAAARAVKALVDKYGSETVQALAALFGSN